MFDNYEAKAQKIVKPRVLLRTFLFCYGGGGGGAVIAVAVCAAPKTNRYK